MWHFTFEAPIKTRILKRGFIWITHFSNDNSWFVFSERKWKDDTNQSASTCVKCNSFSAFKRHLRKHPELQECGPITLVSRWKGHSITAEWS